MTTMTPRDTRAVRLWHWDRVIVLRYHARKAWTAAGANAYEREADMHLSFVVALNDHFPEPGDTAERDADRRDHPRAKRNRT